MEKVLHAIIERLEEGDLRSAGVETISIDNLIKATGLNSEQALKN